MNFRGTNFGLKGWNNLQKLEYDIKLHEELHLLYNAVCKLAIVCLKKKIPLIIENPYSTTHYLRKYWCLQPSMIDDDRRERGDYYKKPTQYWFLNRKPSNNLILEAIAQNGISCKDTIKRMSLEDWQITGAKTREKARSMIHPDYANRFIREFII